MAEEANSNAMEVDQGGYILARDTCPHVLQSVSMPNTLDTFPDLSESTECNIEQCTHTESWVCMKCHAVLCGRYGDQHMVKHKNEQEQHCIAMSCGDLSFWCYKCDDYLNHLRLRRIFEFYKIAHVKKFKHEINNLEKLMERTDFSNQDILEKEQQQTDTKQNDMPQKVWFKGPEILNRKWQKKDAIEYDSDPEQKKMSDKQSHTHKGIIVTVKPGQGSFGKIMIKDDTGSYGNYGLEEISIKLPPATPQNTVKRKKVETTTNNTSNNIYSTSTNAKTSNISNTSSYDFSQYRGYDEKDNYTPPMEYITFEKIQYRYRKKNWSKGDEIEYNSDPENKDTDNNNNNNNNNNHIRKGKIISIDTKEMLFEVKLSTGNTVKIDLNKIGIGVRKMFWCCEMCGFQNGYKTKQCMVCDMNDTEMTDKSKRPQQIQQSQTEEKKNNENSKDIIMSDDDTVQMFFVYGTLRDDDDSGAMWTKQWTMGCNAGNGKIFGYKMYQRQGLNYPFAVQTNNNKDCIVGRIINWEDMKTFEEKKKRADKIEGYSDTKKNSLFHREVVQVNNTDNGNTLNALFYFQDVPTDLNTTCIEIPNGDWLKRKR